VPLLPPSAKTSAGQFFRGNEFRNFPSNQCHWCRPVPKLPQSDNSWETISETFFPIIATVATQRQNFCSRASFPRKQIQKLSFQPVPLVPPIAKTSAAGQVFHGNKFRNFLSNQCHCCRPVPKLPQGKFSVETNSEIFLPTSATGAAQCQNFPSVIIPGKQFQKLSFQPVLLLPPSAKTSAGQVFRGNKFRNFPSNQCHWCRPVPKLPQTDYSRETISETFFPTSATVAAQCQNFRSRASFPQKQIQKFS
jgi:hypothetical protein